MRDEKNEITNPALLRLYDFAVETYGSLGALAQKMGKSVHFFSSYNKRKSIGPQLLSELREQFGLNPLYLKEGRGDVLLGKDNNVAKEPEAKYNDVKVVESVWAPVLMHKVPAGATAPYETAFQEEFIIPAHLADGGKDPFLVPIMGDSMLPDYEDGDFAVCLKIEPKDGDTVVAIVNGEATIKNLKLYPKAKEIGLIPINPDYPPKICGEFDDCYIMGVVVSVNKIKNKKYQKHYT